MRAPYGARILPVSAAQSAAGSNLIGGPVRLVGWSLADGTQGQGINVNQSQAAPGAGVQVAAQSLANGVYNVEWFFELSGAAGAGDVDNVRVTLGAAVLDISTNLGVAGNYGPFHFAVAVTGGPVSLVWKAIGAATAGTTYKINATITPVGNAFAQISDGGMTIANEAIAQGGVSNQWLGDYGIRAQSGLSVLGTNGVMTGTLWYCLVYPDQDYADVGDDNQDQPYK